MRNFWTNKNKKLTNESDSVLILVRMPQSVDDHLRVTVFRSVNRNTQYLGRHCKTENTGNDWSISLFCNASESNEEKGYEARKQRINWGEKEIKNKREVMNFWEKERSRDKNESWWEEKKWNRLWSIESKLEERQWGLILSIRRTQNAAISGRKLNISNGVEGALLKMEKSSENSKGKCGLSNKSPWALDTQYKLHTIYGRSENFEIYNGVFWNFRQVIKKKMEKFDWKNQ